MTLTIGFAVAADYIRQFRPPPGHRFEIQKCVGGAAGGSAGTGRGNRSRGLDVAQTLLVAMRKYLAVVARLR